MEDIEIYIDKYKTYLVLEKSLSSNSIAAYLNDIHKLVEYCQENHHITTLENITDEILADFLKRMEEDGFGDRTQARSICSLRQFFKFLVFDGVLPDTPTKLLKAPKISRKIPIILTDKEVNSIMDAIEMYKPEGQRNKAIIEMLYSCGLRASELIDIKLSNIDFRHDKVKIEGKENKDRVIPLSNNTKVEIKKYLKVYRNYLDIPQEYEDILFLSKKGTALSRVMLFNIVKHLAKKAGIKKRVSPHTLRHSFAAGLVKKGIDLSKLQDLLGHSSILTTETYIYCNN